MICPKLRARPLLSPSHLFLLLQASVPIGLAKKFVDLFKILWKNPNDPLASPIICKSEIGKQDSVIKVLPRVEDILLFPIPSWQQFSD